MSKPFNIHDWQAKQRQLSEIRAQDVPGTAAFMGKNMRSRGMSNSEKNKASVDAFFKDLRDKEEAESMSNVDIDALNKMVKKYSMDKIMKTINILKDRPLPEQTMTNFGPVRSVTKYNGLPIRDNVMDYANEILNQINDYENNVGPGEQMINYNATKEAARALMNAVDRDEEGMMEANVTGTGASFTAGTGAGYMTPKAFKKKRKDD